MRKLALGIAILAGLVIPQTLAAQPGMPAIVVQTLTGWTSATGVNTAQTLMLNTGAPAILVQLNQTTTLTAGAVTFEGTYDGTNWVAVPIAQITNPNTFANLTNPYTLVASTNQPFLILTQGYQAVRVRLSTVIIGTATVTPFVTLLPYNPTVSAILNPLAAGPAIIGKVGVDQTTPGSTNNVSVSPLPRAARNFPGCSVTTTSAQCLATNTATVFLQVQNAGSANAIACAFGGAAVINAAGSFQLAAGQSASWGPMTSGVPTGALNCIAATGTTPLYLEWQ